jgi:hypothetical protein
MSALDASVGAELTGDAAAGEATAIPSSLDARDRDALTSSR